MGVFWQLRGFFRANARAYLIASFCLLCVAGLLMIPPRITGQLVDAIVAGTLTPEQLFERLALLTGIALVVYVLRILWRVYLFGASHRLARDLRNQLYRHWTRLSPANFRDQRIGDLMTRATSDVDAMQMTAGEGVLAAFDGLLTGIIVLAVMTTTLSWDLTLVALIPWPVAGIIMYWIGERLHRAFGVGQARYSDLTDLTQETLSGLRTVRGLGREAQVAETFAGLARESTRASLEAARYETLYTPLIVVVVGLSFLLAVGYGGWKVVEGTFTLGQLTSFTMYLGFLIWPAFAFGWMLSIAQRGRAAWARIQQVLAIEPAIADTGTVTALTKADLQADIPEYRLGDMTVLKDIHVTLREGGVLGLTGPTGAGKSTLLRLLMRLEEAPGADIRWGGIPVDRYTLEALRAAFAWVPQEPFLFSATVRENLMLAAPDASQADVEAAARLAAIHDDILAFPQGYDTPVGERGVTLSGGQKQRIALARALLAPARILVLDDTLSAVDAATEHQILRGLRARRGLTTLIVSHRLSALRHADEILVLDRGQVLERGSHAALVAAGGWYAGVHALQQLEARLEDQP